MKDERLGILANSIKNMTYLTLDLNLTNVIDYVLTNRFNEYNLAVLGLQSDDQVEQIVNQFIYQDPQTQKESILTVAKIIELNKNALELQSLLKHPQGLNIASVIKLAYRPVAELCLAEICYFFRKAHSATIGANYLRVNIEELNETLSQIFGVNIYKFHNEVIDYRSIDDLFNQHGGSERCHRLLGELLAANKKNTPAPPKKITKRQVIDLTDEVEIKAEPIESISIDSDEPILDETVESSTSEVQINVAPIESESSSRSDCSSDEDYSSGDSLSVDQSDNHYYPRRQLPKRKCQNSENENPQPNDAAIQKNSKVAKINNNNNQNNAANLEGLGVLVNAALQVDDRQIIEKQSQATEKPTLAKIISYMKSNLSSKKIAEQFGIKDIQCSYLISQFTYQATDTSPENILNHNLLLSVMYADNLFKKIKHPDGLSVHDELSIERKSWRNLTPKKIWESFQLAQSAAEAAKYLRVDMSNISRRMRKIVGKSLPGLFSVNNIQEWHRLFGGKTNFENKSLNKFPKIRDSNQNNNVINDSDSSASDSNDETNPNSKEAFQFGGWHSSRKNSQNNNSDTNVPQVKGGSHSESLQDVGNDGFTAVAKY